MTRISHTPAALMHRGAVVTGAATGLGAAITAALIARGAQVIAVDIDAAVRDVAASLGKRCHPLQVDLADPICDDPVALAALTHLPNWNLLINNAAWSLHQPAHETSVTQFDRLVAINQRAPFLLSRRFADQARPDEDPCIIHVSSVNAARGNPGLVAYAGTKGALEAMTRAMAKEFSPKKVRVNCVRPGVIDGSNLSDAFAAGHLDPETYWRQFVIPEPTPPDALAEVVLHLAMDAARTITGAIWTVDSGYLA